MKTPFVLVAVAGVVGACSSPSRGPACSIPGLYTVSATQESGTCVGEPTVYTFTEAADGTISIAIQGVAGACVGQVQNTCTWQATCNGTVNDPTTSATTSTAQYSLTFTDDGFSGTEAAFLPPTKTSTNGCKGVLKVSGSRQ